VNLLAAYLPALLWLYGGFVIPFLLSPEMAVNEESEEDRQALDKLREKRAMAEALLLTVTRLPRDDRGGGRREFG